MAVNRDKILKVAEKLVQKGKVEQAIKEYEKLLKANPNEPTTINRVGDLYGRVGQVDKAIEMYEKIAGNFTEDGFAHKAIAIYKKINRLDPQRLDIFAKLAELYIQQGLIVEAKNQYQILADWYTKKNEIFEAVKVQQKLVQLDPDNHMAHLRLADLLMQTGKGDEAVAVYERLGSLLLRREKVDEAERLYRHALDNKPPTGGFLAPLVSALLDAGRTTTAQEFLTDALGISPASKELKALEVRTCLAFGDAVKAKELADTILADGPQDHKLRSLVGNAMLMAGEAAQARDMLIPGVEELLDSGDLSGAQQELQGLLKALPKDKVVLSTAVRAYGPAGGDEMAFTLKAALADSHFRSNEQAEALELYTELLENDPDNKLFSDRIAQLSSGAAEMEVEEVEAPPIDLVGEAPEPQPVPESEATAASQAEPEAAVASVDFDPRERMAEANVFAKYGLVDKAIGHLNQIIESFPEMVEAREKLIPLLVEKGDIDTAVELGEVLLAYFKVEGDAEGEARVLELLPQLQEEAPVEETAEEEEEELILVEIDEDEEIASEAVEIEAAAEHVDEVISFDIQEPDVLAAAPEEGGAAFSADDSDEVGAVEFSVEDGAENAEIIELQEAEPDLAFEEAEPDLAFEEAEPDLAFEEAEPELAFEESATDLEPEASEPDVSFASPEAPAAEVVVEPPAAIEDAPAGSDVAEPSGAFDLAMSELDELERSVRGDARPTVAEPTVVAEAPEAEAVEEQEELVELKDALAGPANSDLEQVDFFIQQELFEDAVRMIGELESDYPNDPEVAERRLVLKSKGVLLEDVQVIAEGPEELFADEEDFIDLAAELEEELAEEEAMVEEATGRSKGEAQLEDVFREFQKGVAEQLSEEDSDTHFNLGIAYKEMGLLPEAIREFQVASRDEQMFVECCSMIGVCYIEQGMAGQAAEWYSKALGADGLAEESRVALSYDLAAALESAGDMGRALEIYQEIAEASPAFRDVSQRLSALSGQ